MPAQIGKFYNHARETSARPLRLGGPVRKLTKIGIYELVNIVRTFELMQPA
jgi:hypothetical protein